MVDKGEVLKGVFPWSVSAVTSNDEEFLTPLLWVALLFVVHGISYMIFNSKSAEISGGVIGGKKLVTDDGHKILHLMQKNKDLVKDMNLLGTFRVLYHSAQVVKGTKHCVTLEPDKAERRDDKEGPILVEFAFVEPPVDSGTGEAPPPFLVPGSLTRRPLTLAEERRRWASVLAHQVVSFLSVAALGVLGLVHWFGPTMAPLHAHVASLGLGTLGERFFVRFAPGLLIGQLNLAFQVYDLAATLAIPDLRSTVERERGQRTLTRTDLVLPL